MLKRVGSKVAWVGRTTSTVFGANGHFFKVGRSNLASAVSTLTRSGSDPP